MSRTRRLMPAISEQHPEAAHGEILSQISAGMVALFKDHYGVAPTQAKTYYHDDLVVSVLRGGFTRAEQTLRAGGRGMAVIEQRATFQEVMAQRFKALVEEATGRPVIGLMNGGQQQPDMICEVFLLSPTELVQGEEAGVDVRRLTVDGGPLHGREMPVELNPDANPPPEVTWAAEGGRHLHEYNAGLGLYEFVRTVSP